VFEGVAVLLAEELQSL